MSDMKRREFFKIFAAAPVAIAAAPLALTAPAPSRPATRITYRAQKGSGLTNDEVDNNFYNLDQRLRALGV